MAAIFNNPYTNTETWSVQGATATWTGGTDNQKGTALPLVMTSLTITYGRQITPVYPINNTAKGSTKYNIAGPPEGSLQVGSILGPTQTALEKFIQAVAAECKTAENSVNLIIEPFGKSCTNPGWGSVITLKGLELASLQVAIQGGQAAIVNMPLTFTFTSLEFSAKPTTK